MPRAFQSILWFMGGAYGLNTEDSERFTYLLQAFKKHNEESLTDREKADIDGVINNLKETAK